MQIASRTRHECAEIMAEFRMTQGECESGFEKSDLAAAVEAPASEPFSEHGLLFEQARDRIGQLNLVVGPGARFSRQSRMPGVNT